MNRTDEDILPAWALQHPPSAQVQCPRGYAGFLEAIRDPKPREHASMIEWIGGDFDPETFDLAEFLDLAGGARRMEFLIFSFCKS